MMPFTLPVRDEPEVALARVNARIAWVLSHEGMSDWLKQALRGAMARDPVEAANDAELLRHLLVPFAIAEATNAVTSSMPSDD